MMYLSEFLLQGHVFHHKQDYEKPPPEMAAPIAFMLSVKLYWFKVYQQHIISQKMSS